MDYHLDKHYNTWAMTLTSEGGKQNKINATSYCGSYEETKLTPKQKKK